MTPSLPVQEVLPQLVETLRNHKIALLEAPPGAGKSTLVPPAVLKSGLAGEGKIYLLEPRRLAARSLAHFIAKELNDTVGGLCGYRVHRESKVSSRTRIEVITEGVLVRMLQSDPALEEGSVVLFDEFHERNILSDLALTLLTEVRETLRDDLILLFMSATPDCEALEGIFPGLPIVRSRGRQFPVEKLYRPHPCAGDPRSRAVPEATVKEALDKSDGDILIFLPGEREIRHWQGELSRSFGANSKWGNIEFLPLYGRMPLEKQNRIISPPAGTSRRIILATDIAETSLTIPGITAVVDRGLARRPLYNPASGLTLLATEETSLASAEQRAGRAGRTAPGICFRLWDPSTERGRDSQTPAEILRSDLTPLVLELSCWGCTDRQDMKWLTPPPPGAWKGAVELLEMLGATDGQGKITPRGQSMSALPVHPRLAALLLYGKEQGLAGEASLLAAFLGQRDFLPGSRGSDVLLRLDYLCGGRETGEYSRAVKTIREEAFHLEKLTGATKSPRTELYGNLIREGASLMAQAYPDRIAMKVGEGIYQLSGGGRVILNEADSLGVNDFLVAAHCGGQRERQKLFLGLPIERKEVEALFEDRLKREVHGHWDKDKGRIRSEVRRRLGEITLSSTAEQSPGADESAALMKDVLLRKGLEILSWDKESRRLLDRLRFAAAREGEEWPDMSDTGLAESVGDWLIPFLDKGRLRESLSQPLLSLLAWPQRDKLDRIAPDHYKTALGNRRKIFYGEGDPYLAVPLQEMYGTLESPRLGHVPLVLHLLNPAGRPVQITSDLKSFWKEGWPAVRSELKGRYPKHYWPEDPAGAQPSLKTGKNRPD
ncbi:MAG: ATP-dependent helicase HrpB [Spirochaetales bacterium]|nr:ATP-dependent helicase HrpB [Spirochaetales bacterium]